MSIVEGELTSIALCWRLERCDGAGIGLTSHDRAVTSDAIRYDPTPGIVPAAVTRSLGLDPHSAEVTGALSAEALDEKDLALGRWNSATVGLTAVDWQNTSGPEIYLFGGEIGTVSTDGESFSAELNGASTRLEQPVCPATSAECRAAFGDKQCRVDLAGRTISARVVDASDTELTLDAAFDERFVLGRLRYMSGANCGLSTMILAADGSAILVRDEPPAPIEPGCKVELREGCDKRFDTCVSRFANAINFRGEPHLPGNDLLTRYPGI